MRCEQSFMRDQDIVSPLNGQYAPITQIVLPLTNSPLPSADSWSIFVKRLNIFFGYF